MQLTPHFLSTTMSSLHGTKIDDSLEELPSHIIAMFIISLTGAAFFMRKIINTLTHDVQCVRSQKFLMIQQTRNASVSNLGIKPLRGIRYSRHFKSKSSMKKTNDGCLKLKTPPEFKEQLKALFSRKKLTGNVSSYSYSVESNHILNNETDGLEQFQLDPNDIKDIVEKMPISKKSDTLLENIVEQAKPSLVLLHIDNFHYDSPQLEVLREESDRVTNILDAAHIMALRDCSMNRELKECLENKNSVTTIFTKSHFSSRTSVSSFEQLVPEKVSSQEELKRGVNLFTRADPNANHVSESGDTHVYNNHSIVLYDPLEMITESFESIGFSALDLNVIPVWCKAEKDQI